MELSELTGFRLVRLVALETSGLLTSGILEIDLRKQ
jgi:hypothetical protein